MSDMALEIARMIDMLPADEQRLAYEVIKRLVIAWDPDFTKLTSEEARRLEEAEFSGYVDEEELGEYLDGVDQMEQDGDLSVYDKIKTGLEEAIAFERGELSSHTRTLEDMRKEAYE